MTPLPMFPLGSVLFPHMPLILRIFEDRYVVMLSRVLQQEPAEFGVVLIERGQEVGGGERRFPYGTVAEITQLESGEGFFALAATGGRRVEVVEWLDEDPHPQAEVRDLPDLEWDVALTPLLDRAEKTVRRTLAKASEFTNESWPAEVELSDDPVAAAWQLAAIAPLGAIDQLVLLRSSTTRQLLDLVIEFTSAAEETLALAWGHDGPAD
jgi:Lon protease-like protein